MRAASAPLETCEICDARASGTAPSKAQPLHAIETTARHGGARPQMAMSRTAVVSRRRHRTCSPHHPSTATAQTVTPDRAHKLRGRCVGQRSAGGRIPHGRRRLRRDCDLLGWVLWVVGRVLVCVVSSGACEPPGELSKGSQCLGSAVGWMEGLHRACGSWPGCVPPTFVGRRAAASVFAGDAREQLPPPDTLPSSRT